MNLQWSKLRKLNKEELNEVPSTAGVYRLSYRSAEGSIYVFYIGKADISLKDSILNHLGSKENNTCIKTYLTNLECYFRYAEVANKDERLNCEKSLYVHYSPKCNLDVPKGKIIEDLNFS